MRGAGVVMLLTALACLTVASPARADAKDDAAAAYDKGAAAYDKGDYVVAASELARADELAPNAVTLELAINAALRADEPVLGMTLVERAEKRRGTKVLDKAADTARRKLVARVGKLNVACPSDCEVKVDGKRFDRAGAGGTWLTVGTHDVAVDLGGSVQRSSVTIEAGKTVELLPTAPSLARESSAGAERGSAEPRSGKPETEPAGGPSPTWFWVALGVTAVVGGASVVSGLDTASKHDEFVKDRSNVEAASAGRAADERTTILVGATGVFAVATAAIGLFVVDWGGGSSSSSARAGTACPRFMFSGTGASALVPF